MRRMKIPPQDFALKMQGGLMREGRGRGGVFAGPSGITPLACSVNIQSYSNSL